MESVGVSWFTVIALWGVWIVVACFQWFMWRQHVDAMRLLDDARRAFETRVPKHSPNTVVPKEHLGGPSPTFKDYWGGQAAAGLGGKIKPKVITEEREALLEQRLAKEAQARDPIFP